jgi:hypothetical protein
VRGADAGVDHVGGDAGAGTAVGELLVERQERLVDPVQAPGGAGLGLGHVHGMVGFHAADLGVGFHVGGDRPREDGGVALEGVGVDVGHLRAVAAGVLRSDGGRVGHRIIEDDDVPLPWLLGGRLRPQHQARSHEHDDEDTQQRSAHSPAPSLSVGRAEVLAETGGVRLPIFESVR